MVNIFKMINIKDLKKTLETIADMQEKIIDYKI